MKKFVKSLQFILVTMLLLFAAACNIIEPNDDTMKPKANTTGPKDDLSMDTVFHFQKDRYITNRDLADKSEDYGQYLESINVDINKSILELTTGELLIIDPQYLADIYYEDGPKVRYLVENGVLLNDFGGDRSGPVVATDEGGIKIILAYEKMNQYKSYDKAYYDELLGAKQIDNENLGCDGGSYIFLDYTKDLQELFANELVQISYDRLFILDLKPGRYHIGYEQWETTPDAPYEEWRRNLVIWPD